MRLFCLDKRKIVVDIVNTVLKDSGSSCKINLLDEGTSTYWRSILDTHFPINDIYSLSTSNWPITIMKTNGEKNKSYTAD